MTTVLSNATDQETLDRVKDLYVWSAANRFADDDEPITIATLQDWRSRGEVSGPLSRDEFIRMVREQHIDETTIVWEVWDGTRVWPKQQAEKLTLFREAHRAGIFHTKPPPPASTAEPTDGVSADEIVASVLEEIRVESITKSSLLWRLPLFGWLLALCGWKPLSTPIAVMPADSNSESAAMPLSAFVSRSGINPAATTVTADPNTAKIETDIESSSSSTEAAASSLDTFGGLSLDSLDDANSATPAEISELPYTNLRRTVPEASQAGYVGTTDLQSDESSPDGKLDGAIANALNYFDAKAAKSLSHRDKLDAAKPRLVDQLIMAVVSAGRLMIAPFRGLVTLAGKAVASERTLVTGESFQRLDESLRRGLKHPVTWGTFAGGVFVGAVALAMAMQPDRPDELDIYAVRKLKEAQEAIQAVRAARPDEKAWAEFSQTLTDELTILKEALQKDIQKNRPIKEGLYLELEYRLPRILKEGRLKPSPVEGELATRLRDAERRIKSATH